MKYKKTVLGLLAVSLLLGGCQKAEEKAKDAPEEMAQSSSSETTEESIDFSQMKNGEQIQRSITDEVKMNAKIVLPEKSLEDVEICHVLVDNFDVQEQTEKLLGEVPENIEKIVYSEQDTAYLYQGNLGAEFGNMEGNFGIEDYIYLSTDHWDSMTQIMPLMWKGYDIQLWNEECEQQAGTDLPFETRKEAEQKVGRILEEKTDGETYRVLDMYSFGHEILEERQKEYLETEEAQAKPIEHPRTDWGEKEDCYWMRMEQDLEGIPILSHSVMRSDDLYVPSQEITVGYTSSGIENLSITTHNTILEKEKATLQPYAVIEHALRKKFELMFAGNIEITQMKLIYFPLCTGKNAEGFWNCDMIPAWEFTIQTGNGTDYVYINAVDGVEIYG